MTSTWTLPIGDFAFLGLYRNDAIRRLVELGLKGKMK
jgi:hypothetical protein